jgi:voltage-gated potassium channel
MQAMDKKTRQRIYIIIFGSNTKAGKLFDILLLIFILLSVLTVMLDSVPALHRDWQYWFIRAEWFFTVLFTVEYLLRIYSSPDKRSYIFSFYGIIDLLSILPTYLSLFIIGYKYLVVIRILRLLRVFRILKLAQFLGASKVLTQSLKASRFKIFVFLEVVLTLVVILGSMMYLIEGPENGFDSIPRSIYWAIVTLTTVGYGDIAPQTIGGQALASLVMILGYAIIAVPTGIITVELTRQRSNIHIACTSCGNIDNDEDAQYCKQCGSQLEESTKSQNTNSNEE